MSVSPSFFQILLYVSVMWIIAYLQQEFVFLPEIQNLDIVGEAAKAELLARWVKMRWLAFVLAPVLLLLRLSLVALCLFVGSFFFADMAGKKYRNWWDVAMNAQWVLLFYSVLLCVINLVAGANDGTVVTEYTSLLFLGGRDIEQWIRIPLSAINFFEILYWFVMASLVSRLTNVKIRESLKFVLSTYGVGFLFYISLLMFLVLYIS